MNSFFFPPSLLSLPSSLGLAGRISVAQKVKRGGGGGGRGGGINS